MVVKILFWFFAAVVFYTHIGYTLVLMLLVPLARVRKKSQGDSGNGYEPEVSLLIPAYNEIEYIGAKMQNTLQLDYPASKLNIIWITDGSDDGSQALLGSFDRIILLHDDVRRGKAHALNRAMKTVHTPIVFFTDANTMLSPLAIREVVRFFRDEHVGCVAGAKRIVTAGKEEAVSAGEGIYWRYESLIKRLESATGSIPGAAGELFAIRRELYTELDENTILDDFFISMQVAMKGYRILYAPGAWATEHASLTAAEEMKRKIRIAAGGMQALVRMPSLLSFRKYGLLAFKYISHKVLRWTLVPVALAILVPLNALIVIIYPASPFYLVTFLLQCIFYLTAAAGALLKDKQLSCKFVFLPYYLTIMNYAVLTGFFRFLTGNYSVKWTKVRRRQ